MKKFISFGLMFCILATTVLSISGCYVVDGSKIEDIIGTYKLEVFNTREQDSEDLIDEIALNNIECYLVVRDDGLGFFVYQDDKTELICKQVKLTYGYSQEDPTLVEYVKYEDATGTHEQQLAYNAKGKELNHTQLAVTIGKMTNNYELHKFRKVDKAVDLSYVEEQIGEGELDYNLYVLEASFKFGSSFAYFRYYDEDTDCAGYAYVIVDIDYQTLTAGIYTANLELQSSCRVGLNVNYEVNESNGLINKLTIDDMEFELEPYGLMRAYNENNEVIMSLEVGDYDSVASSSDTDAVSDVIDRYLELREEMYA